MNEAYRRIAIKNCTTKKAFVKMKTQESVTKFLKFNSMDLRCPKKREKKTVVSKYKKSWWLYVLPNLALHMDFVYVHLHLLGWIILREMQNRRIHVPCDLVHFQNSLYLVMIIYLILTAKNECPASEIYIECPFRLFLISLLQMPPKRNSHEKQIIMEGNKHIPQYP